MNTGVTGKRPVFLLLSAVLFFFAALVVYTELHTLAAIPFVLLLCYAGWEHPRSIFFLLLFSLPFSFEYDFPNGLGTDIPDEFLMLLVSVLFAGYCLYHPGRIKPVLRHPLLLLLGCWLAWMAVTICFSSQPLVSLKFFLAKGWYAGAFVLAPLIVLDNKKNIRTAAIVFASAMMLVTMIILLRHSGSHFTFSTIHEAVVPFFRNHVNYSAMLVCTIPVLVAFYVLNKGRRFKIFLASLVMIALAALFFSYARGAWLALLTGLMAGWLTRRSKLLHAYVIVIIFGVAALFWLKQDDRYLKYAHDYKTTIFHQDFNEHLVATYRLKDVSTAERFYRWIAGVRMVPDHWLTGTGPGTFHHNYKPYTVPAYRTWVSDNKDRSTVHNYFLLVLVEQGLPGLLLFLVLCGALLGYAQQLYQRCTDPFYKTVALVTGVIFVMLLTLNTLSDLVETDKAGSLFFLCFALLVVTDINSRRPSDPSPHVEGVP